jgi:hypothetical protein
MRALVIAAVLVLAGCGATPASLGITGPGEPPPPPPAPTDSTIGNPGLPDAGYGYGPSVGPNPASGQYFNYN